VTKGWGVVASNAPSACRHQAARSGNGSVAKSQQVLALLKRLLIQANTANCRALPEHGKVTGDLSQTGVVVFQSGPSAETVCGAGIGDPTGEPARLALLKPGHADSPRQAKPWPINCLEAQTRVFGEAPDCQLNISPPEDGSLRRE